MLNNEQKILKCNALLVDSVFELMFETLWMAPYDRRRHSAVWCEFDRCARRTVVALSTTDLAWPDAPAAEALGHALGALAASVRGLDQIEMFPPEKRRLAEERVRHIYNEVRSICPAAEVPEMAE